MRLKFLVLEWDRKVPVLYGADRRISCLLNCFTSMTLSTGADLSTTILVRQPSWWVWSTLLFSFDRSLSRFEECDPHCSEGYTGFIQGIHYPENYPGKGIHPPHPLIIQGIYPDDYNYNNIRKQNKKFRSERNKFKKFQNKFNTFVSAPRNKFKNFRSKQNTLVPTYYITYLGYPGNYPGNLSREKLSRELSRE